MPREKRDRTKEWMDGLRKTFAEARTPDPEPVYGACSKCGQNLVTCGCREPESAGPTHVCCSPTCKWQPPVPAPPREPGAAGVSEERLREAEALLSGLIYPETRRIALEKVAEALEKAASDRDCAWWQTLALADSVPPEPQAVKRFVLQLHAEEVERLTRERERVADDARAAWDSANVEREARKAAEAALKSMTKERDALLYTSDKQTVAWKERALKAEADLSAERKQTEAQARARLEAEAALEQMTIRAETYGQIAESQRAALESARAEERELVLLHALLERCQAVLHTEDDQQGPVLREIEAFLLGCAQSECRDASLRASSPPPSEEPESLEPSPCPTCEHWPCNCDPER